MIENTMMMICNTLVRLAAFRSSFVLTGFLFDFLFAISYLVLTRFCMTSAMVLSSSSIVTGFLR